MRNAFLVVAGLATSGLVLGHGGGLNAEGCHNNRKTGDYHCHRAPTTAMVVVAPKPAAATKAPTTGVSSTTAAAHRPTCHVGPRGGTYTITASGRKNYGGC